jgi:hypothetical protein
MIISFYILHDKKFILYQKTPHEITCAAILSYSTPITFLLDKGGN